MCGRNVFIAVHSGGFWVFRRYCVSDDTVSSGVRITSGGVNISDAAFSGVSIINVAMSRGVNIIDIVSGRVSSSDTAC